VMKGKGKKIARSKAKRAAKVACIDDLVVEDPITDPWIGLR